MEIGVYASVPVASLTLPRLHLYSEEIQSVRHYAGFGIQNYVAVKVQCCEREISPVEVGSILDMVDLEADRD